MEIPNNITKGDLQKASDRIISEGIPNNAHSSTYDVLYENELLPAKLIVSYANIYANGKELERTSFKGGKGTECFNLLEKNGFQIIEKSKFYPELIKFLEQSQTNNLKYGHYIREYKGLKVKVSFGQGTPARITWITFLRDDQTASNGIYPVYLFYKKLNLLILSYGISETNVPQLTWDIDDSIPTIMSYFADHNYDKPYRYGNSFVNKVYDANNLPNENTINSDLDKILSKYKNEKQELKKPETMESTDVKVDTSKYDNILTAIQTKPFILLAGLSGTGKSRIVRELAYKTCNEPALRNRNRPGNYELITVKPNWHDSSELLGYVSRISGEKYISTMFIKFIVKAWKYENTPFFLCLDEMNLAPVEQYFAEYLSIIETRNNSNGMVSSDPILDSNQIGENNFKELLNELGISNDSYPELYEQFLNEGIQIPNNLVVMGTVNMDETTHSFSRKVLDRAMTIEMNKVDLRGGLLKSEDDLSYLENPIPYDSVIGDKIFGYEVYQELDKRHEVLNYLEELNEVLNGSPFKVAYRVRDEFLIYIYYHLKKSNNLNLALDNLTFMKVLSRIEGDEGRVNSVLMQLKDLFEEKGFENSLEKVIEMKTKLDYGYTSFWS